MRPEQLFTFAPPWARAPIHLAAFRDGQQRATVAVASEQVLTGSEWDALALTLDRGLMYDLAPDAAWEVLELREAHDRVSASQVLLIGAERNVQRGPWSTAGMPLPPDLLLLMRSAAAPYRHALGTAAAVRAQLAVQECSGAGALGHPLWHFPAGTPTAEVQRFLHRAQPDIGPDVWHDLQRLHADLDLRSGTPARVALRSVLTTRSSGPRRAAQVHFLSWDNPQEAGTLNELNLAALEDAETLILTLGAALHPQCCTDAASLIGALRPHAALLSRGFTWSDDPQATGETRNAE